jgi:hypothetical protein
MPIEAPVDASGRRFLPFDERIPGNLVPLACRLISAFSARLGPERRGPKLPELNLAVAFEPKVSQLVLLGPPWIEGLRALE